MYCGSCLQIITRFGYPFLILIPNCDHVMPVVATTATASLYNPNKEAPLHDAYSQCVMETNAGDEEVLMLARRGCRSSKPDYAPLQSYVPQITHEPIERTSTPKPVNDETLPRISLSHHQALDMREMHYLLPLLLTVNLSALLCHHQPPRYRIRYFFLPLKSLRASRLVAGRKRQIMLTSWMPFLCELCLTMRVWFQPMMPSQVLLYVASGLCVAGRRLPRMQMSSMTYLIEWATL